jgi:hypothetical protein
MCCYNRYHGNAVMEFWALWDNICDYLRLLRQILPSFLTGNLLAIEIQLSIRICKHRIITNSNAKLNYQRNKLVCYKRDRSTLNLAPVWLASLLYVL